MKQTKTEGIIIKRRNIGEADRILTIFTKTNGKISIKASGVRKITSRRASHIELLNESLLFLYKGRGMPVLTEVQIINSNSNIKNNLKKIGVAYYFCELVDGLCAENEENGEVYDLLKSMLVKIGNEEVITPLVSDFETKLLKKLGYFSAEQKNTAIYIEEILEKKLKTPPIFHQILRS